MLGFQNKGRFVLKLWQFFAKSQLMMDWKEDQSNDTLLNHSYLATRYI